MEVDNVCHNCFFWIYDNSGGDGFCHRHSPKLKVDRHNNIDCYGSWPKTGRGDFCGDWEKGEE